MPVEPIESHDRQQICTLGTSVPARTCTRELPCSAPGCVLGPTTYVVRAAKTLEGIDPVLALLEQPGGSQDHLREQALELTLATQSAIGRVLSNPVGVPAAAQQHLREADMLLVQAEEALRQLSPAKPETRVIGQLTADALAHIRMAIATTIGEP